MERPKAPTLANPGANAIIRPLEDRMSRYPTPQDVRAIANIGDLPLRNRRVTHGYWHFAHRFREHLGADLTWPAFAVWASAQAGRTIRKEDLRRKLEAELAHSPLIQRALTGPLRVCADYVLRSLLDVDLFEPSSQGVSRGNIKVFGEIGVEFARFLEALDADPSFSWLPGFLESLPPGDPPGGKGYLRRAFRAYAEAVETPPGKRRTELVLLGNCCIGYHEQTRLQPEIEEAVMGAARALSEVPADVFERLPFAAGIRGWLAGALERAALRDDLDALLERISGVVRQVVTQQMMELELPKERLRLGHDLRGAMPDPLLELHDPELRELLTALDPTPDSLAETGAADWTSFAERIHFILDLFRSRHFDVTLFETPADIADMA
jgi:hypothetical protein